MHIILGLLAIAGAALVWYYRARHAADIASELTDAARDVRLAARRFGFRRRATLHPADSIDDARVAASGILNALARSLGPLTDSRQTAMVLQMQSVFDIPAAEARELAALGGWMADQCGAPGQAVIRLSRRLHRLTGAATLPDMERMIHRIFAENGALPEDVAAGLLDLRRILHG